MIKKVLIAGALLGLSTAAVAGPSKGDWEIVFSNAGGALVTDGDATTLAVGIRAGYFMDSVHEFGFGSDLGYVKLGDESGETLNLAGFYRYNMATADSTEWMYGGLALELTNVTNSDASTELVRPHFGKKWMLSDDVAFDINGGVLVSTESGVDPAFDARLGLTIFF